MLVLHRADQQKILRHSNLEQNQSLPWNVCGFLLLSMRDYGIAVGVGASDSGLYFASCRVIWQMKAAGLILGKTRTLT